MIYFDLSPVKLGDWSQEISSGRLRRSSAVICVVEAAALSPSWVELSRIDADQMSALISRDWLYVRRDSHIAWLCSPPRQDNSFHSCLADVWSCWISLGSQCCLVCIPTHRVSCFAFLQLPLLDSDLLSRMVWFQRVFCCSSSSGRFE